MHTFPQGKNRKVSGPSLPIYNRVQAADSFFSKQAMLEALFFEYQHDPRAWAGLGDMLCPVCRRPPSPPIAPHYMAVFL